MNKEKKNFVLQKIILKSLFYVHFLSLYCAGKERKRTKRKKPALIKRLSLYCAGKERKRTKRKKPALIKRNSKMFYQRFCCDKLRSKSFQNITVSSRSYNRGIPPVTPFNSRNNLSIICT